MKKRIIQSNDEAFASTMRKFADNYNQAPKYSDIREHIYCLAFEYVRIYFEELPEYLVPAFIFKAFDSAK